LALTAIVGCGDDGSSEAEGIEKIEHVVIILMENRSFDHYFGTFPGAEGLPRDENGEFTSCLPQLDGGPCMRPYHDPNVVNSGAGHNARTYTTSYNDGKMDGFLIAAQQQAKGCATGESSAPVCIVNRVDVMGYHDARELPNYWRYAEEFVLHDHMFVSAGAWSLPNHLYAVSGWAATCTSDDDPMSCTTSNEVQTPKEVDEEARAQRRGQPYKEYPWTDITYLLHKNDISWRYYVETGLDPDCLDVETCKPVQAGPRTDPGWNPLPRFTTVRENDQLDNIQDYRHFLDAAREGELPAVSWLKPAVGNSEHTPYDITVGQAWMTKMVNAVMESPNWESSAIFITRDEWGGFYDHVAPPIVDDVGYGFRIPALTISPYAKRGYIDKQTLSLDAYLKFIEDRFLDGQRLDPKTTGRPDSRPVVREELEVLGDLRNVFDFEQEPREPVILEENPPPGPASEP
jgi:phospholipase C